MVRARQGVCTCVSVRVWRRVCAYGTYACMYVLASQNRFAVTQPKIIQTRRNQSHWREQGRNFADRSRVRPTVTRLHGVTSIEFREGNPAPSDLVKDSDAFRSSGNTDQKTNETLSPSNHWQYHHFRAPVCNKGTAAPRGNDSSDTFLCRDLKNGWTRSRRRFSSRPENTA